MVFNFDKPETKDFTETVRLLAQPVQVRHCRYHRSSVSTARTAGDRAGLHGPVQPPSFRQGEKPFAMFVDLQNKYDWVLQPVIAIHQRATDSGADEQIVRPAESKVR